ncbi:MAG: hypothetical protein LBE57_02335 [Methanosarcinales archaeon]|jgi:Holliday junction resolvase|nr:hypothetical protein [Methanosarcinales archaeon]
MGFLDKLLKAIDVLTEPETDESVEKGHDFEKYILDLFEKNDFTYVRVTSDYASKSGAFVESSMDPDLVLRCKKSKQEFAVECKFRSGLYWNKERKAHMLQWSNPAQIGRYKEYQKKHSIPVFVVIGLGGYPDKPECMFCIPLNEAKYADLFESFLGNFERGASEPFKWNSVKKELI